MPALKHRERITIPRGSKVVWQATRKVPPARLNHASTGRIIKLTTVWDGRANQPSVPNLSPGTYSVVITDGE